MAGQSTSQSRYANHASGRKYDGKRRERPREENATKAESASIFREYYEKTKANRTYARLRRERRPSSFTSAG